MALTRGEQRTIGALLFQQRPALFAIFIIAFVAVSAYAYASPAFTSSEVRFADASRSGLAIVPASCPSSPHYAGECSVPETPTLNTLTTSCNGLNSQITLSWTSSTNATEYHIERCTSAGCTNFSEIGTATGLQYTDTGRTPGTRYRYRVRAHNHTQGIDVPFSAYSNINHADAMDCSGTPDTPTNLTASSLCSADLDSTIHLSWDYANGATEYRIERCTGTGCTNFSQIGITGDVQNQYTDTNRTPGVLYRYRVYSFNLDSGLSSPYSNVVSQTANSCENPDPPGPPTNLTTSLICGNDPVPNIMLSWGFAVGATEYRIERCTNTGCMDFGQIGTAPGSAYTYTDTDIELDKLYRYRARSFNSESGLFSVYSSITSQYATRCDGPDEILDATATLWAIPALVRRGETTKIYWTTENMATCKVSGTNTDYWEGRFSGTEGKETSPITTQTIYTLSCTAPPNARPSSITESKTVNVIPIFEER